MKSHLKNAILLSLLLLLFNSKALFAVDYWVTKTGNDNNNCTDLSIDACLTIQKGVSILTAGDTLNVGAGIYTGDGGNSPYIPNGTIVGWLDGNPPSSNVVITVNGTPGNLITIQAIPGEEGLVTIDGENQRMAIHMQSSDYIRIKGFNIINSRGSAITSWGQTANAVADVSRLSIGVIIENNRIINTTGDFGTNVCSISMWGSKDWVVRNNYIDTSHELDVGTSTFNRFANGIMAYGVINALIENNEIVNVGSGIFWKDHFLTDIATRGLVNESEVRFNKITALGGPVYIGIKGSNTVEAGDNYIHHNILYGHGSNEEGGVRISMAGAFAQSGDVRIEHNLIDGEGIIHSRGISIDASRNITIIGNIIIRTKVAVDYIAYDSAVAIGKKPVLNLSNYNIYNSFNSLIGIDKYGSLNQGFTLLSTWQTALANQFESLNYNNPDMNSITESPANLFNNLNDKKYIYKPSSPAIGFMTDGSNAGPYQYGNETIGLLPQWPGGLLADVIYSNGFE